MSNNLVPIFVTRPTADGDSVHFSFNGYVVTIVCTLVFLNIAIWSCIGLYEAVRVIF